MRRQRNAEKCAQYFRDKVSESSSILDCGCGSGSVTLGLAAWAPLGKTTGIDINADQLANAKDYASAENIANVDFHEASIFHLPFEDNQFDIVFAQALLLHIPDHSKAINEMRRVLKPGGYIAIRDADLGHDFLYPQNPVVEKARMVFRNGIISSGGNPDVGRTLGALLLSADFEDMELSLSWEYSPQKEFRDEHFANIVDVIENGELGNLAVEQGWITETDRKTIGKTVRGLAGDPAAIWGLCFVQALARKPGC